jgi:competence protein ComEC
MIGEKQGGKITIYTNDSILKSIDKNTVAHSYCVAKFCKTPKVQPLGNLIYFNRKKIFLLDSTGVYPKNLSPDILLITQSPKINLSRFLMKCRPKIVIADGSNYKTYVTLWEATCKKEKIPFHATAEKGFCKI